MFLFLAEASLLLALFSGHGHSLRSVCQVAEELGDIELGTEQKAQVVRRPWNRLTFFERRNAEPDVGAEADIQRRIGDLEEAFGSQARYTGASRGNRMRWVGRVEASIDLKIAVFADSEIQMADQVGVDAVVRVVADMSKTDPTRHEVI